MAYNKSKAKGATYESKIAKVLTETYGIDFKRVPLSGSLEYWKGDIFPPKHLHVWPYSLEVKHYKELEFKNLLTAKSNDIYSFWKQAVEQAKKMEAEPLLIFRWNRSKDYIVWNTSFNCKKQMEITAFNYNFKIALLEDWLLENKELLIKLKNS